MWKSIIFAVVFVAFAGAQFAEEMICYSCNTPDFCNKTKTETCNDATSTATSSWLSKIHIDVAKFNETINSTCLNITYFGESNDRMDIDFSGCYYPSVPKVGDVKCNGTQELQKNCSTCALDKCNGGGSLIKNTYTIIGLAMALILAKLFG